MRLWSLHPKYLDSKGLVALWREALLAQKVLAGNTKGYKHHPQLIRFKECAKPLEAMGCYLSIICQEAANRGYSFNKRKILFPKAKLRPIPVSKGQMRFEFEHLKFKCQKRSPKEFERLKSNSRISAHPIFKVVRGKIHIWEKGSPQ